jgi:hypothetical protein
MSTKVPVAIWWKLYLRKARGENLAAEEQQLYEVELARLDGEMPITNNVETLRQLRAATLALEDENAELRTRLTQLAAEVAQLKSSQAKPAIQLEPLPDDDWFFQTYREAIEANRRLENEEAG